MSSKDSSSSKKPSQGPGLGVQLLTAGSAACFADLVTFPLDTVKVRQQIHISCEAGQAAACTISKVSSANISEILF